MKRFVTFIMFLGTVLCLSAVCPAQAFKGDGYKKIYVLKGGWLEWRQGCCPTEPKEANSGVQPLSVKFPESVGPACEGATGKDSQG
ncbi:MAG: hypothetical protein AB2L11_11690 [Syntrophobacteraceae bacterium]